ncbi:hypothetical protein F4777DRAFT_457325 [Nemania sp. FL0916]|nr:hypothetical protein F4777DRAFT_457325 [Nemania sp. FL0916]
MSSQWSEGVIPPPQGVVPNFVDPPNQMSRNIAIHAVFLTLSTLFVTMRIYTRLWISKIGLGPDDYLCLFAYGAVVTWSGILLESFRWGIGRHMWDEPMEWLVPALKFETVASLVHHTGSNTVKLSILFLYRRLFDLRTKAKYFINGAIVAVAILYFALLIAIIFLCIPVQKAWDNSIDGHCSDPVPVTYLSGVSNSVIDIYVLLVPVPLLWKLNMRPKQKLKLSAVFGIGIFACAASLVRLGFTPVLQSDPDSTYNLALVSAWATIEINVGLICSCLILLPTFLKHYLPRSNKYQFHPDFTPKGPRAAKKPLMRGGPGCPRGRWQSYQHRVHSDPHNISKATWEPNTSISADVERGGSAS